MQKKTTDTLTMTSSDRHIVTQIGLPRLCRQFNLTMTMDKKEERKSPRFTFLKISANAHCTHLQSRSSHPATQALQKSAILPTLNYNNLEIIYKFDLFRQVI